MAADFRDVITHPNYSLPFLQPGRLVKVKYQKLDFGWGAIANFQKRLPSKVCRRSLYGMTAITFLHSYHRMAPSLPWMMYHLMNSISLTLSYYAPPGPPYQRIVMLRRRLPVECSRVLPAIRESRSWSLYCCRRSTLSAVSGYSCPRICGHYRLGKRSERAYRRCSADFQTASPFLIPYRIWILRMTSSRLSSRYVICHRAS